MIKAFLSCVFLSFWFLASGQNYNASIDVNEDEFVIEYIAHACFRIHTADHTIMIDPYADKVWIGYSFPTGLEADTVFITHPHYDHDGGIHLGKRPDWLNSSPFIMIPKKYSVGNIDVQGYTGLHAAPYGKEFSSMNAVWVFTIAGITICHIGDNGPITEELLSQLPPIDILMLPVDTHQHILRKDALKDWIAKTGAKVVLPMHYRIDELEPEPEKLTSLGPVDYDFMNTYKVNTLKSNFIKYSRQRLPKQTTFIVLDHYRK
ncbi:MAG: MBL fold metallo-hydrolase [Cyclobacteriaceae bacterium]